MADEAALPVDQISAATQLKSRADKAHLRQIARRAETTSATGSPVVRRSLRRWRESQFWQLASIIHYRAHLFERGAHLHPMAG
ncbi:MAG: hypothetical protein ACLP4V_29110 [Methylocella sp.]|jgi:hypothetical protein